MAHFAQLDENNKVIQVIVVANENTADEKGVEKEEIGIAFCKSLFGENTKWVQTSYNGKTRGGYAAIGDTYDEKNDVFILRFEGSDIVHDFIDAEVVEPTKALE